jgi:cobalamin synthase
MPAKMPRKARTVVRRVNGALALVLGVVAFAVVPTSTGTAAVVAVAVALVAFVLLHRGAARAFAWANLGTAGRARVRAARRR